MISFEVKGDLKKTENFFKRALSYQENVPILEEYARKGVEALAASTPVDTGRTAAAWTYKISYLTGGIRIDWLNTNVDTGVNVAVLLQYGHGTGNGGYVVGRDYINPAIQPIFDQIANAAWKDLTK